jgi:hypothetical protein
MAASTAAGGLSLEASRYARESFGSISLTATTSVCCAACPSRSAICS